MAKSAFVNSSKNKPVLGRGSNPTKNAKLHLNLPNPLSDARLDSAQQIAEKIAASLDH